MSLESKLDGRTVRIKDGKKVSAKDSDGSKA